MPLRAFFAILLAVLFAAAPGCDRRDDDDDDGGGSGSSDGDEGFLVAEVVGPAGGALSVTDPDSPGFGAGLVVPPGALASDTEITIRLVETGGPWPADVLTFEFGPEGTVFAVPVTVTVPYTAAYVSGHGITDPATLHVVQDSAGRAPETLVTTAADPAARTVSARTTHFSFFGVLGYSDASLLGDYFVVEYFIDEGALQPDAPATGAPLPKPLGFGGSFGTLTFDGAGGSVFSGTEKYDFTLTPVSDTEAYSVDPDGTLTFDGDETGSVLSGGEMFVTTTASAPNGVSIRMGLKMGGSFSTASLAGDYFVQEFAIDETLPQPAAPAVGSPLPSPLGFTSSSGVLAFDGAGGFSGPWLEKFDQTLMATTTDGPFSVASNGVLSVDGEETGFLLAGGDAFVVATSSAMSGPSIQIGLRKGGSFSDASLDAEYTLVSYRFDAAAAQGATPPAGTPLPNPLGFVAEFGLIDFDGAGGYAFTGTRKSDFTLAPLASAGTYAVAPDGSLTLDSGTTGWVLAGGRIACFLNSTAPSDVSFSLLILRR